MAGGAGPLHDAAGYLVALRPIVADALRTRHTWLVQLGRLLESVRHGNAGAVTQSAGRIGREHVEAFRDARNRATRLRPPPACADCHAALVGWLHQLVSVCELLVAAAAANDLTRLRETQELLADARRWAQRFNADYARAVADLRRAVREAERDRARAARRRTHRAVVARQHRQPTRASARRAGT